MAFRISYNNTETGSAYSFAFVPDNMVIALEDADLTVVTEAIARFEIAHGINLPKPVDSTTDEFAATVTVDKEGLGFFLVSSEGGTAAFAARGKSEKGKAIYHGTVQIVP